MKKSTINVEFPWIMRYYFGGGKSMKYIAFPAKKCPCGRVFPTTRVDKKYCSHRCAARFGVMEKRKKALKKGRK